MKIGQREMETAELTHRKIVDLVGEIGRVGKIDLIGEPDSGCAHTPLPEPRRQAQAGKAVP